MFEKKEQTIPNIHLRIDSTDYFDYQTKIELIKKDLKTNKKYNILDFTNKKDTLIDDKSLVRSDKINIVEGQQFLNLNDFCSIQSLLVNYICLKKYNGNKFDDNIHVIREVLHSLLQPTYSFLILKLNNQDLTINNVLKTILNYESIVKDAETFLCREILSQEKKNFYISFFEEHNLKEIINEIIEQDLKIEHEDFDYKDLFFKTLNIYFHDIDVFYGNVLLDSIIHSGFCNVLGTRIVESDFQQQKSKLNMTNRKRVIVFLDETPNSEPFPPMVYSMLRGLGVYLIYPDFKKTELPYFNVSVAKTTINSKCLDINDSFHEKYYFS